MNSQRRFLTTIFSAFKFCLLLLVAVASDAQTGSVSQYEFVESTSRLADGRTVTRRTFANPATPSQVIISSPPRVANLPTNLPTNLPRNNFATNPGQSRGQLNFANTTPALSAPPTQLGPPPGQPGAVNVNGANGGTFALPPHLPPSTGFANNQIGTPSAGQVYPYPSGGSPGGRFFQSTGNGPQPLIKLRTLPSTAYVGQGILGQPTAYVPGEPIRNMLRYIMP